jgi:hypothetical protein
MIDMQAWKEYYSNEQNLLKIANACKYREVIIIKHLEDRNVPIRPLKIFALSHILFWIERLSLKTTLFDLYASNTSVRLPALTSDIKKLDYFRKYLSAHWAEIATGNDLFIDVDIDDEKQRPQAKEMTIKIANELRKQYPTVQVWDTSRGYHGIVLGQFMPSFAKETIMDACCKLDIPMSMPIKEIDGIRYIPHNREWVELKPGEEVPETPKPNVDTRVFDDRRIRRVFYSLHSKTGKPMVRLQ